MLKIGARKTHEKSLGPATTVQSSDKGWMSKAIRSKQPRQQPATGDIASQRIRKIGQIASRVVLNDPLQIIGGSRKDMRSQWWAQTVVGPGVTVPAIVRLLIERRAIAANFVESRKSSTCADPEMRRQPETISNVSNHLGSLIGGPQDEHAGRPPQNRKKVSLLCRLM